MDRIHLAHDRDRWRVLLNVIINPQVPENARNFLTSLKDSAPWSSLFRLKDVCLCTD